MILVWLYDTGVVLDGNSLKWKWSIQALKMMEIKRLAREWFKRCGPAGSPCRRCGHTRRLSVQKLWTPLHTLQGHPNVPCSLKLSNVQNDIIFGSNEEAMSQSFSLVMQKEFEMSFLGELTYFLGVQIQQNEGGILLSQTKYLKQILKKYGMEDAKRICTPMVRGCNLSTNDKLVAVHQPTYRSMIGSLHYLTGTKPDIMHAVGIVGRFQENPKETHLQAVKRIFKYLEGTQNYGLWYPRDTDLTLHAYIDVDWAGSVEDMKSTSGGEIFMGSRLVSWFSKKQSSIALSTAEVEYVAAASSCTQLLWMKQTLQDFQITCTPPISILWDNTSAISISKNPVMHSKTKHIPIKYHFLREQVLEQKVKLEYVPSKEQVDDIITKPLPRETFEYLRQKLGVVDASSCC
eukprot:PITA_15436